MAIFEVGGDGQMAEEKLGRSDQPSPRPSPSDLNSRPVQTFGRYRLVDYLASGGMADVYRAEVPGAAGFVKEVAVKLIRGEHSYRDDFVQMFIQEARLASKLCHANIVQIFDFDQIDGCYYIAMEYVNGRTLRQVMDACKQQGVLLSLPRVVQICTQIATALSYAHRLTENGQPLDLVHRDVSPQNVLISFEGEVKLSDFGIARTGGRGSDLTRPGTIKGKLAYIAPEQARAEPVDGRADVFSLGVMLWELCTGFPPFERDTEAGTLAAILGPQPELARPSVWNAEVPPDLDEVVMRALERDREERTRSAQELANQLSDTLLKLVKSAKDVDLREFMLTLWPDGSTLRSVPTTARLPSPDLSSPPRPMAGPSTPSPQYAAPTLRRSTTPRPVARTTPFLRPSALAPPPTYSGDHEDSAAENSETDVEISSKPHGTRRLRNLATGAGIGALLATLAVAVVWWMELPSRVVKPEIPMQSIQTEEKPEAQPASEGALDQPIGPPLPAYEVKPADLGKPSGPTEPLPESDPVRSAKPNKGEPRKIPRRPSKDNVPLAQTPSDLAKKAEPSPKMELLSFSKSPDRATLRIVSEPWGTVVVDDEPVGHTPFTSYIRPGRHRLRVERTGFETVQKAVELRAGGVEYWKPTLSPISR